MFPLFSPKDFPQNVLQNFVKGLANIEHKVAVIRKWQAAIDSGKAANLKETQQDMFFLGDIFGEVLDYDYKGTEEWNLEVKPSTFVDATRPDAVLGLFKVGNETTPPHKFVKVVVELKEYKNNLEKKQQERNDKLTPVGQAFSYVPKLGGTCSWVIVSNIECIRLYHASDMLRYQEFFVKDLLKNGNLEKFLFLLHKSRLFGQGEGTSPSLTDILYAERRAAEDRITIEFYNAYRDIREVLFFSLCKTNPEKSQLSILTATQKLIDRLIFICFARDVIPMANVLGDMKQAAANIYFEQDDFLWELLRKTFRSYNKGFSVKIPLFNGGLFADDEFLNSLLIKDFQLLPLVDFLLQHDFQSDLNVTILGHIFEQSIADLEQLKEQVTLHNGQLEEGKLESKRKIDGVFYTPDYITQYIVQHSVGAWLEEQKEILLEKYQTENKDFWTDYQNVLRSLRVLDPACGSGAFLVAVFNFLWVEWQMVLRELQPEKRNITSAEGLAFENSTEMWQIRKAIIENNLFGVDLNMESVEITKLSLWILQANKTVPLSDLSPNIKQGNSLIADKTITEWAFDWQKEFPFQFDVVVGNPPYVVLPPEKLQGYQFVQGNYNTYIAFFEKSFELLRTPNSFLGFIVPNTWFAGDNYTNFRNALLKTKHIQQIVQLPYDIFDAYVDTSIIILKNQPLHKATKTFQYDNKAEKGKIEIDTFVTFDKSVWERYGKIFLNKDLLPIGNKVWFAANTVKLGEIAKVNRGCLPPKEDELSTRKTANFNLKWFNHQVFRYNISKEGTDVFVNYDNLQENKSLALYECPKILARQLVSRQFRLNMTYTEDIFAFKKNLYAIYDNNKNFDLKYILAILNSKLFSYCQINFNTSLQRDDFPAFSLNDFKNFAIPIISLDEQQKFVNQVNILLGANQELEILSQKFTQMLFANFGLQKTSRNIDKWFTLSPKNILKEFQKQRIHLTLKQKEELFEYLASKQEIAKQFHYEILDADNLIDKLVYQLFQLDETDIQKVEAKYKVNEN